MDVIELRYAALQCYLQARGMRDPIARDRLHDVGALLSAEADGLRATARGSASERPSPRR